MTKEQMAETERIINNSLQQSQETFDKVRDAFYDYMKSRFSNYGRISKKFYKYLRDELRWPR